MKKRIALPVVIFSMLAFFAQAQVQEYVVNYTANPPVIDGVRSSGEWTGASAAAGNFRLLRTAPPGSPATENITWQALFDSEAIYLILETNFSGLQGSGNFTDDTVPNPDDVNIFFNPNRNDEPNEPPPDGTPSSSGRTEDSYQIIVSIAPGTWSRISANPGPPGLYTQARYDALFGDLVTGSWAPQGVEFAVVSNATTGATLEIKIPFADLTAQTSTLDHMVATDGVTEGERWQFNIARIASDGSLPVWQYHAGTANPTTGVGAFFAEREYGEIVFQGIPEPPPTRAFLYAVGGRVPSATEPNLDPERDAVHEEINVRSVLVANVDLVEKTVTNWRRAGVLPATHFDGGGILHWSYLQDAVNVYKNRLYVGPATYSGTVAVTADFVAWADINPESGHLGAFSVSSRLPHPNPTNQRISATEIVEIDRQAYYYVLGGNQDEDGQTDRIAYAAIDPVTGALGQWQVSTTALPTVDWFNAAITDGGKIIHSSGNVRGSMSVDVATPSSTGNITSPWSSAPYSTEFTNRWDHVMLKAASADKTFTYLLGGSTTGLSVTSRVDMAELVDGIPQSWSAATALPEARRRMAGAAMQDMIVIPGGASSSVVSDGKDTVFIGVVANDGGITWSSSPIPMLQARSFHGAAMAPAPTEVPQTSAGFSWTLYD